MEKNKCILNLFILLLFLTGCRSYVINNNTPEDLKNNFTLKCYNTGITNPDADRRSYYRIFIDKVEAGRTTTGLESQIKIFEANLSPNRHLLKVEKWVINKGADEYMKLNNIDQPKPSYKYFDIKPGKKVLIDMKSESDGKTRYTTTGNQ